MRLLISLCVASLVFAASASAQTADTISVSKGKAVTVVSGGKTIKVGTASSYITGAKLMDLDADGQPDAVVDRVWEDGSGADLWLRRGDAFVKAASVSHTGAYLLIEDVDSDGALEVLAPAPTADGVFAAFQNVAFIKSKGDDLQLYRRDGDKYVMAKIECVAALGPRYTKAMDELEAAMVKNKVANSTGYGKNQFMLPQMEKMKAAMAVWRKKFADGCPAP